MNTIVAQSPARLSQLSTSGKPLFWQIPGLPVRIPCSTPYRLGACVAAILAFDALFFFVSSHAIQQCRGALKSVGLDCAPSIVAAQWIRTDLADLDANLFNQLLCEPSSKERRSAEKVAADRHRKVSEQLVAAAKNITFGDNEQIPIVTMVSGLGAYESIMAAARAMQLKSDDPATLADSREAAKLLHESIIPAADALDRANTAVLDKTFAEQRNDSRFALAGLILSGILLAGVLVLAQIYLTRRTHRLLNAGLLAATVIALFISGKTALQVVKSSSDLRAAVDDAFASVHYLWQARAIGYDANGEESRYLFDRENAAIHERAFLSKTADIAKAPPGERLESIASAAGAGAALPGSFTGTLARELGNITFPGERAAAAEAVRTFAVYLAVDQKIRALEKAGRHADAIALCLSDAPGGSNRAFDDFDAAVEKTLEINQKEFDRAITDGLRTLSGAEWIIAICVLLVAAGTLAGYRPRLKEY